jgi:hypothetical protein
MGAKQERHRAASNVGNAEKLLTTFQELFTRTDVTVSKLDPQKTDDHWLALEIAMRGKTTEEYFSIVDGIFSAHEAEKNKEKKNALSDLASHVMSLGERNLGIDWS